MRLFQGLYALWVLNIDKIKILCATDSLKTKELADLLAEFWYKSGLSVLDIKIMSDKMLSYSFDQILYMQDLTKFIEVVMDFYRMPREFYDTFVLIIAQKLHVSESLESKEVAYSRAISGYQSDLHYVCF